MKPPAAVHHIRPKGTGSDMSSREDELRRDVEIFHAAGEPIFERDKHGQLRLYKYAGTRPPGSPEPGSLAPYDPGHKGRGIPARGRREDAYPWVLPESVAEFVDKVERDAAVTVRDELIKNVTAERDAAPETVTPVTEVRDAAWTAAERAKRYRERKKAKEGRDEG